MTLKYDVVVAGSGPAGAAAAFRASQNGASVLLVEKNKEIGYPVQCGEYFPKSHEMTDLLPNNKHTEIINNISQKMIDLKTRDLAVISPTGKEYFFNLDAYVIDRKKFDQKLADNAVKHVADIKLNFSIVDFKLFPLAMWSSIASIFSKNKLVYSSFSVRLTGSNFTKLTVL